MAFSHITTSSYAVIKMMGTLHPSSFSLACNSTPDILGMRTSTIKHATLQYESDSRNAFADPKHRASIPADSTRSHRESRIKSLSSMMATTLDVWPGMPLTTCGSINQTESATEMSGSAARVQQKVQPA